MSTVSFLFERERERDGGSKGERDDGERVKKRVGVKEGETYKQTRMNGTSVIK